MTDDLEDLNRRRVVGHKSDGRSVYDGAAKSQLVALRRQPGASVSLLANECGVSANQVSSWIRKHGFSGPTRKANSVVPPPAFVAVAVAVQCSAVQPSSPLTSSDDDTAVMDVQPCFPNGVAIDIRGVELRIVGQVIEIPGRLRCSASTKN